MEPTDFTTLEMSELDGLAESCERQLAEFGPAVLADAGTLIAIANLLLGIYREIRRRAG